jgi:hypothetical protein
MIVLVNPYRDAIAEILMNEWKEKSEKKRLEDDKNKTKWTSLSGLKAPVSQTSSSVDTIGKYLSKK